MFLEFDDLFSPTHLPTSLTIDLQRQHFVGILLKQRQRRTIVKTSLLRTLSARLAASSEVIASPAM